MKLFAKLLIAILFIAMLLPFTILKDDGGDTLMSFSDFSWPEFSLFAPFDGDKPAKTASDLAGRGVFYQWYDAEGNVQFTTDPPPAGVEYIVKEYDSNTNVIRAVKLPSVDEGSLDGDKSVSPVSPAEPEEIGSPYSQEAIKKLFEDSKNIEKMLKERLQRQEALLN